MSPGRDRTCLPSARLRRREATWSGAGRGWELQGGTGKELQYLHPFCFLKGSQLMPVGALTKGGGQSCSCWGDPGSRPRKALRETLARHFGIFFKLLTPLQMKPAAQRGAAEGRGYWDWRGPAARLQEGASQSPPGAVEKHAPTPTTPIFSDKEPEAWRRTAPAQGYQPNPGKPLDAALGIQGQKRPLLRGPAQSLQTLQASPRPRAGVGESVASRGPLSRCAAPLLL